MKITKICKLCNKAIQGNQKKGNVCWSCVTWKARSDKKQKLIKLTGGSCWICGYDRCWRALDFHHVNPEDKSFQLTEREMQYAWDRVEKEARKCVLICCRCHREVHADCIDSQLVEDVYRKKWDVIDGLTAPE